MKDEKVAKEAAIQKLVQSILPEIERQLAKSPSVKGKSNTNDVTRIFENILSSGGIDGRDSFKSRHECLQFIQKVDCDLFVNILEKQGSIRDLDILDRGGDDDQGMTCLMWAVFFNWEQVARIIIDLGANGQLTMNCDRTHLMVAAWRGSTSLVEFIVEMYPSQLGLEDVNKNTALVTSLTHNRYDVVQTLIACDEREMQKSGDSGLDYDTALLKAIDMGSDRTESALLLVPKVKNVNNGPRKTPYLYKAAIDGNLKLCEALIKEGAQVDKMKRSSGTNAIMEAARKGHVDIVRLLLQHKADPNLISDFEEDNDTGYTALHFAARFNNYQCIQLLIDHGADIQVESTNRNYTPYVIAIRFKAMEAQKLLATGKCELAILLEAVNSKNVDSVDHLLTSCEHSPDQVNAALVECCKRGYSDTALLLLKKFCADSNSTVKESKNKKPGAELSCVLLAAMRGHLGIVEELLNQDANFLVEDENGATAVHYVMACNGSSDLIEQLMKKYGISAFTKKDKNDRSAIYYANKEETLRNLFKLDEDDFKPRWLSQKDVDEVEQVEERNLRVTSDTFPEAVIKFESLSKDILDRTIQPIGYGPHDQNLEVKVDFSFFYKQGDLMAASQLHEDVLESLLQNDSPAIHHPAIKMFLLKKYNGFPRLYARLQFWLYFLLTIAFTSGTIISVASDNGQSQKTAERLLGTGCSFGALILTVLAIIFELLRLDEKGFKYFAIASSWFRIFTYLGALIATVCQLFVDFGDERKVLQSLLRALQSFEVLGLFFNMLLTLRRSAVYGIYVSIFCNVLENVVKLTFLIGLMILAFSASFYCIFQNEGQYNGMGNTGFKVVSMMMGSVEPEEVLASPSDLTLFFAQSALFVIFLIFMAIITMNLLIGLAISDVAAEIPLAKQTHLSQLTDHIVQSENIARALPCFGRFCFKDKEAVIDINKYDTSRGVVGTIASCFAPKSTPQFEQELIEELKTIVQEIYVLNTIQKC